jgi:hypothetical protein
MPAVACAELLELYRRYAFVTVRPIVKGELPGKFREAKGDRRPIREPIV